MKEAIIIGKGWIGSKLEEFLKNDFKLTTTKRNSDAENCLSIDFDEETAQFPSIFNFDSIIITIPFGKRNTHEELFIRFTNIQQFIGDFKGTIILLSSTGIYPDQPNFIKEDSIQHLELNEPYQFIEDLMLTRFPQLTILRLGGIMGKDRYLSKYIDLTREGLDEMVNHVHYDDILNVIKTCLEKEIKSQIFNVVAPQHPTKRDVLEFQINENLIHSEIKKGKTILSDKLVKALNYQFIHPNPLYFKD